MKNLFSFGMISLLALAVSAGCDQTQKYNPSKGLDITNRLQGAENGGDSLELAKLALEQNKILKDRKGAMETMGKAVRFCSDIPDSRSRIEAYSQIADSYWSLNAIVEARKALNNAMEAYRNWEEEKQALRAKSKKEPTQGELEGFADEKLEMLLNLAKAQAQIAPIEAQNTLGLALKETAVFSDLLIKVDKMLDIGSTLGKMQAYDQLMTLSEDVQAYLDGNIPESAAAPAETESETSEDPDAADTETSSDTESSEDGEGEIRQADAQQKGSRLNTLAGIFFDLEHKDAKDSGLAILAKASETAHEIGNRGQKAITLCGIALNYVKAGDKEKAKELVAEAEEFAKKADSATRESADEAVTEAKAAVE